MFDTAQKDVKKGKEVEAAVTPPPKNKNTAKCQCNIYRCSEAEGRGC
jgi:hypothetical protein